MSHKTTPPSSSPTLNVSRKSRQEMIGFYESVLRFSHIYSLPVNGSWSALYHRHHMSRTDTSVQGEAPQETSITRRWMEMYQQWINTPNNFPSSLPHCNRCYSSVVFSLFLMVQCGSTFVYLCSHSRTCLEWIRKLDVQLMELCICMCRWKVSLKEITQAASCTRWGCVTPL